MSPAEILARVHESVVEQRARAGETVERDLRPALAEHGIRILTPDQASPEERRELDDLFERQVFPVLTPLVIGRGRPFPYISNLSLSLVVVLRDPEKDNEILARVKVPKELLGRFLSVGEGDTLVPLDALIAANLESLFPGMEVLDHSLFRVTRDTDYDVSDEAADMLQAVEEELRRRRFGEVVRLEIDRGMSEALRDQLTVALGATEDEVYEIDGLIDLGDLMDVVGLPGHDDLRDPPFAPATPARIRLKMNSLLDAPSIRALYRASQAGVEVQINVRGICALRPGVRGVSDRITVTSVVGRFLEHSRIYSFERHGEAASMYIGSADLMPRNLYNRVELVAPIFDDKVRAELIDVLDRSLADNTNSWELGEDGDWTRRRPDGEPRNVQRELIERHTERSASTAKDETPLT
jgi:polyphosphate kinase